MSVKIVFLKREDGERRTTWYRRVTVKARYKGVAVLIRPDRCDFNEAAENDVVLTEREAADRLVRAYHLKKIDEIKWERFRFFCEDERIPSDGRLVRPDGGIDVYQPDCNGYPTLVLSYDANGEVE